MKLNHTTQTHETKPTKSNNPAVKLYLHIGGNTPKAKWISCPVAFGLWSSRPMNLEGEELKLWKREKQKLREREKRKVREEREERREKYKRKRKSDRWE